MSQKQKATLREKALVELRAMVEYAMSTGKTVPPSVTLILEKCELEKAMSEGSDDPTLMSRSADYSEKVPVESEADLMRMLTESHNTMTKMIGSATPEAIVAMKKERDRESWFMFLGKVGLVRKMNMVVIFSLLSFFGLFATDEVNMKSISGDILSYDAKSFLLNQAFLLTMAALGAAFYNLFEAYKFITDGTYDSKYESIYWIRFTLGVVSGIMLSEFIITDTSSMGSSSSSFTRPLLAFLGGFSARVVYRILSRLVDTLEAFIDGSAKDVLTARDAVAKTELDQKLNQLRLEHADQLSSDRMNAAMQLIKMKEGLLQSNGDNAEMKAALDKMLADALAPVTVAPAKPAPVAAPVIKTPAPVIPIAPTPPAPISPEQFLAPKPVPPAPSVQPNINQPVFNDPVSFDPIPPVSNPPVNNPVVNTPPPPVQPIQNVPVIPPPPVAPPAPPKVPPVPDDVNTVPPGSDKIDLPDFPDISLDPPPRN